MNPVPENLNKTINLAPLNIDSYGTKEIKRGRS